MEYLSQLRDNTLLRNLVRRYAARLLPPFGLRLFIVIVKLKVKLLLLIFPVLHTEPFCGVRDHLDRLDLLADLVLEVLV